MNTMAPTDATATAHADSAVPDPGRGRRFRLSGMTWLVWRQHRAAYWILLFAAVVTVALFFFQRHESMTYLDGHGWPDLKSDWEEQYPWDPLRRASFVLWLLPVLIGVFVGAPLLAGDLETSTATLVNSQSVSPVRWLVTKLGLTALVVVVCTTAVSAAFTWWWSPVKTSDYGFRWSDTEVFNNTGPVLTALTLLTVVGGVAIGMLLRRTLASMVVTLGFAVAVQTVWAEVRMMPGQVVDIRTYEGVGENTSPEIPAGAYEADTSYLTSSGDLIGWGNCAEQTEKATQACLDKKGVVGWSVEYIPVSEMPSMQWIGASVMFAVTAGIAAFIIIWGRKRLV